MVSSHSFELAIIMAPMKISRIAWFIIKYIFNPCPYFTAITYLKERNVKWLWIKGSFSDRIVNHRPGKVNLYHCSCKSCSIPQKESRPPAGLLSLISVLRSVSAPTGALDASHHRYVS